MIDSSANLVMPSCASGVSGPSPNPLCVYDKGRGMSISVAGSEVKSTYAPFFHSSVVEKDFYYHKVRGRGR